MVLWKGNYSDTSSPPDVFIYLMIQYGRKTSLTLCISPSCHDAVSAIYHDNVRKTHDVNVFIQNERLVQF